jgi:hypothetical protein
VASDLPPLEVKLTHMHTSFTLFIFLLPQFLINHQNALDVFVTRAQERTLCLIAMDEAHIHIQHETAFHDDICALCVDFFRRVFGNQPTNQRPRLIVLSATFSSSYLHILSSLLTANSTIGDCVLRGLPIDFCQCKIDMKLEVCSNKGQFVSKGLLMVTDFLQLNRDSSVIIFCNSRKQSQQFSLHLDKKLDQAKLSIDVININESLDKIDKFWRIRLFCDDHYRCQGQYRALVTTNASNVGIDKHSIALQVQFEWPPDLLTYFQERGRGSSSQVVRSSFILFGDFASFINLMSQLLMASKLDDGKSSCGNEVEGFNSAISPWKHGTMQQNAQKKYPLGPTGRRNLCKHTKLELHEVIHFFVSTLVANTLVMNATLQQDASTLMSLMYHVRTLAQFAQGNGTINFFQCIVQVLLHSLST